MLIGRSARRLLIVSTAVTVCGVLGAGSAAAATTSDSEDLLGLGGLLNSLTLPVTQTLQPALAPNSDNSSPTLGSTLESLPVLGPVVTPLVKALPLLTAQAPTKSSSTPAKPLTTGGGTTTHRTTTAQPTDMGSTWTAPRIVTPDPAPVITPSQISSDPGDSPAQQVQNMVKNLLPTTAAGKAELGAAAIALIILGGVAVAGAAGAAGATGRRQFVGGPW
ncbi:MAG TPA: hypothetical protein VHV82_11500 [Sporichthyaceae bacterium]|jgi:hypothetical protein|nr:hypothetical protein [Sporichthyaceae bacterium]